MKAASKSIGIALLAGAACAPGGRHPSRTEQLQIIEWQSMVAAAREPHALAELRARAEGGLVEAQSALGQALPELSDRLLRGEGLAWLARAAEARDPRALVTLGKWQLMGVNDVSRDYGAAYRNLDAAAALHETRADYYLALMFKNGYGVVADAHAAAKHLAIAADDGIPAAMFLLGNAYRDGDGVPKDQRRAVALYEQAAEHDVPAAIQALAMAYGNGELGLPRDADRAHAEEAELADALRHAPVPP